MALNIIKRPYGYALSPYIFPPSTTISSSGGDALIDVGANHGLSTGSVIYIYSSIGSYNGLWPVTVISPTSFKLQALGGGFQKFTQSALNEYFKYAVGITINYWNCIHLPIVYVLQSNLWPTNSVDTSRTVAILGPDGPNSALTCSGSLGTFNALQYVKITGANTASVNGTWQILKKTSSSVITVNIPYNVSNDFTNGVIILYYNNYHVSINVWSGLNNSHYWGSYNPYVKLTTINVVPDNNNLVKFNLNEYLKADINVLKNNLSLDTLPNNTDAFTQFYIEYEEVYDTSNGTVVSTFASGYVSDKPVFEGFAMNAKLPFKNTHAGAMSNYIYSTPGVQKFLTNFTQPTLTPNMYFDISFIQNGTIVASHLKQDIYVKGVLKDSILNPIASESNGVYRIKVSNTSWKEDQQKISLIATSLSPNFTNPTFQISIFPWIQQSDVNHKLWIWQSNGSILSDGTSGGEPNSAYLGQIINCPAGTFTINVQGNNQTTGPDPKVVIEFYGSNDFFATKTLLGGDAFPPYVINTGVFNRNYTFTTSNTWSIISMVVQADTGSITAFKCTLSQISITAFTLAAPYNISETKTIDVNNNCYDQNYYLTWMNPLGGFDYWNFTGRSDHDRQINSVTTQQQNIFTNWPNSWGEFADTIINESKREVNISYVLRSQNLTKDQLDAVAEIKDSPLVQLINNDTNNFGLDRRTLLLDKTSFHIRKDGDKTFNISFTAVYTDLVSNQQL